MTVCVIGAGPAGLFAAIEAAKSGAEVFILEKNSLPGRKLLLTGSGQCNLTHHGSPDELLAHMGPAQSFLKPSFYSWSPADSMAFFSQRGVPSSADEHGKVFPLSRRAADVLEALMKQCRASRVKLITGAAAVRIDQGFSITCRDHRRFRSDRIILAPGGASYPATGSSGDGFALVKALGHTIEPPRPALCAVQTGPHDFSKLSGLSVRQACITLYKENRKILSHQDDLLVTPRGFSGPVILNRSRYMHTGDELEIDFSSGRGLQLEIPGGSTVEKLVLSSGIPRRLARRLIELSGTAADKKAAEVSKQQLQRLRQTVCSYRTTITLPGSFSSAMVTAGGVSLKEINRKTMESRLVPGLFFAGECIDIDGETGGYNLQAAWSTGKAAGSNCV